MTGIDVIFECALGVACSTWIAARPGRPTRALAPLGPCCDGLGAGCGPTGCVSRVRDVAWTVFEGGGFVPVRLWFLVQPGRGGLLAE